MLQYGSQITLVVTVKILFIAPNRLGDAILASGLIEQCRRRYPGAQFTIACGPVAAPLFQALPGLVEILVLRKSSGWRRWRHWADLLAVGGTQVPLHPFCSNTTQPWSYSEFHGYGDDFMKPRRVTDDTRQVDDFHRGFLIVFGVEGHPAVQHCGCRFVSFFCFTDGLKHTL